MLTGRIQSSISVAGIVATSAVVREAEGGVLESLTLPAGKAGTLTTRTDNDTGVATLSADHGIVGSDVVAIFWDGGKRYNVVVDSVDGNAVTFGTATPGAGDNLPVATTALVMTKQLQVDADFDGDDMQMISVVSTERALVCFSEEDDTVIKALDMTEDEDFSWAADTGETNPLTGDPVGTINVANGTTTAAKLKIGIIHDNVT